MNLISWYKLKTASEVKVHISIVSWYAVRETELFRRQSACADKHLLSGPLVFPDRHTLVLLLISEPSHKAWT